MSDPDIRDQFSQFDVDNINITHDFYELFVHSHLPSYYLIHSRRLCLSVLSIFHK